MKKVTKARKYNSSKLKELLDEVTPLEMEQTKNKMQLAARIEDLMRAKGWNKSQFAEKVGKHPSEITKWLSGTQNYYGVFNHMIEDNITYLTGCNSIKSRVISWLIYALIILSLFYILFTL